MGVMKKPLLILFLLVATALQGSTAKKLETMIQNKDWPLLAAQFGDGTYQQAAAYFQECQRVAFSSLRQNDLTFFARFRDYAEIGEITFVFENGLYRQLTLTRNIKPLQFIQAFSRYDLADLTIRMGDAEIFFKKGVLFQGLPMDDLFIFCGEWTFSIRPQDAEERLTLLNLERSEGFKKDAQAGIFILKGPEIISGLPEPQAAGEPQDQEAMLLYEIFQKKWGMRIPFFDELWYLPFAADFNTAIFFRKPGKSYFRYIFNSAISPDTSLVLFPENKFYLNYNAVQGLKFTTEAVDELEKLQLNLFYNPEVNFLSGTAVLDFKEPANIKTVNLAPGLVVKGYGKSQQNELQLFQREDTYFLLGQKLNKFGFYYAGNIEPNPNDEGPPRIGMRNRGRGNRGRVYLLNRDQDFYPNPGHHFFPSRVKVALPFPLHCLASGSLRSQQKLGDHNEFVYESPGTKGVSLVCGDFEKLLTIPSKLPIQVFGPAKLKLRDFFPDDALQGYFDFLVDKFGMLEVPEVNLLLRRYHDYGGWSNQGFVIFNLLDTRVLDDDLTVVRRIRSDSPVVFTDVNRDSMVHELAHQWWGGIISWKTYQDVWLTEGLAQFSTLLYLQDSLGEKQFRRAVASAKRWVFRKNDSGPIIYGQRIANLSEDLYTYQSIIYNKAALVFLMLRDILGEDELLDRLRRVLADFKYQSLSTARFIQHISQDSQRLRKFFNGWIYTRQLPEVSYQVNCAGANAEITFSQKNSDFVFPVSVRIATAEGKYVRTLIVEAKVQKFKILENTPIQSIEIDAGVAPIKLLD